MKHCGHHGAEILVSYEGRAALKVCDACARTLVSRWLRDGYCWGNCADAVEPDPHSPGCIRYRRPWEPREQCLHCGHRLGFCVLHWHRELVTGAST